MQSLFIFCEAPYGVKPPTPTPQTDQALITANTYLLT